MTITAIFALLAVALQLWHAGAVKVDVNVSAVTSDVEADWTAVYYSKQQPLLLGNDGGPDKGGFHVYSLEDESPLPEVTSLVVGRTKLVSTVYGVGGKDLAVTIATPDSIIRLYEMPTFELVEGAEFKLLGDWSALCPWKAKTGNQYFFIFGKRQAVQFLVRSAHGKIEIVEVSCSRRGSEARLTE